MQKRLKATKKSTKTAKGPVIAVDGRDTLANAIRRRLADQILNGDFAPDSRLDENELANQFGVSRTPVREALRQLDAAGLVELRPRRGAKIVPIDKERISYAFEAAAELEALTAYWAASRATLIEKKQLETLYLEGDKALVSDDSELFAKANRRFHHMISQCARNPVLASSVAAVRIQTAPFQKAQFARKEKISASQKEHEQILTAICFQDPEAARQFMKEHILRASLLALEEDN